MSPTAIRAAIDSALRPGSFFIAPPGRLRIQRTVNETVPWEMFRGHLLDPTLARGLETFDCWHVFVDETAQAIEQPLVSIKWQPVEAQIHVTRCILTHGFAPYEDAPGVILSRPVEKWIEELVGTIEVGESTSPELSSEVGCYLLLAVIGTSRLPITSLESPLPAFSLGRVAFVPGLTGREETWSDPIDFLSAALRESTSPFVQAKALETALRAVESGRLAAVSEVLVRGTAQAPLPPTIICELFRTLFNNVALSPFTTFVDHMIASIERLAELRAIRDSDAIDLLAYMLRHLSRHLTAFDLTLFHSFGANYPDALFLDSLLKSYVRMVEANPALVMRASGDLAALAQRKRLRRRALRAGCLLRKQYEGHRVPDAPTSMGENLRVLPEPFVRVPEEQIVQTGKRTRLLFDGEPLSGLLAPASQRALDESLSDLSDPHELAELGRALFLDRPLGIRKQPGEVDRTPLLSHVAVSRAVIKRRLAQLKSWDWISASRRQDHLSATNQLQFGGLAAASLELVERPGVVSAADALKVASDFVFERTTRGSLDELLANYDLEPLARLSPSTHAWLTTASSVLLLHSWPNETPRARASAKCFDADGSVRLQLGFGSEWPDRACYRARAGAEFIDRLQVLAIRANPQDIAAIDVSQRNVWISWHNHDDAAET